MKSNVCGRATVAVQPDDEDARPRLIKLLVGIDASLKPQTGRKRVEETYGPL